MAKDWKALVCDDYAMVMPLPYRTKFRISYLYQPLFTQQLGIFSKGILTKEVTHDFLSKAINEFSFAEIMVQSSKAYDLPNIESRPRTNYILHLDKSYKDLCSFYSQNLRRNLNKAKEQSLMIREEKNVAKVIDFYLEHTGEKVKEVSSAQKETLLNLAQSCINKGFWRMRSVSLNGRVLATDSWLHMDKRSINLLPSVSMEGKMFSAGAVLLDSFIEEFAGSGRIIDFEGSEVPGVARFYRQFNPTAEEYTFLRWNRLPMPFRMLKK